MLHGHQADRSAYDHQVHYGKSTAKPSWAFAAAVAAMGTMIAVAIAVRGRLMNRDWFDNSVPTPAQDSSFDRSLWMAGGVFALTMVASVVLGRRSGASWLRAAGAALLGLVIAAALLLWLSNASIA